MQEKRSELKKTGRNSREINSLLLRDYDKKRKKREESERGDTQVLAQEFPGAHLSEIHVEQKGE